MIQLQLISARIYVEFIHKSLTTKYASCVYK